MPDKIRQYINILEESVQEHISELMTLSELPLEEFAIIELYVHELSRQQDWYILNTVARPGLPDTVTALKSFEHKIKSNDITLRKYNSLVDEYKALTRSEVIVRINKYNNYIMNIFTKNGIKIDKQI